MDKQQREDIQRTLGRLEGTLDQIEKKQTAMCKDIKTIQKDVTRLKIRTYSISGIVAAVSGGVSGFLTQLTKI
jgi:septal ring factor EnvC (AmiA/AmiB activator)